MVLHRLTDNDHAALHEAVELVRDVLDRHPHEMTAPILARFNQLVRDVRAIEGMFDAGEEAA